MAWSQVYAGLTPIAAGTRERPRESRPFAMTALSIPLHSTHTHEEKENAAKATIVAECDWGRKGDILLFPKK